MRPGPITRTRGRPCSPCSASRTPTSMMAASWSISLTPGPFPNRCGRTDTCSSGWGGVYKQLNAPFGQFGMDTLALSTKAVKSGTATDDSTYTSLSASIGSFTDTRDALAARMKSLLDAAAFHGERIAEFEAAILILEAEILLNELHSVAQH